MRVVPARRLLQLVLGASLLAAVAGPLPDLIPLWLFTLGAVVLLAVIDLARSILRMQVPSVSVPPVQRFSKDRAGILPVIFTNPDGRARRVRFALQLPPGIVATEEEQVIQLPASARAKVEWICTPRDRGLFKGERSK